MQPRKKQRSRSRKKKSHVDGHKTKAINSPPRFTTKQPPGSLTCNQDVCWPQPSACQTGFIDEVIPNYYTTVVHKNLYDAFSMSLLHKLLCYRNSCLNKATFVRSNVIYLSYAVWFFGTNCHNFYIMTLIVVYKRVI